MDEMGYGMYLLRTWLESLVKIDGMLALLHKPSQSSSCAFVFVLSLFASWPSPLDSIADLPAW